VKSMVTLYERLEAVSELFFDAHTAFAIRMFETSLRQRD